jgi:tetratricopeptide (TPR) repeat protein
MKVDDQRALARWPGLLSYPEAWQLTQDHVDVDPGSLARALCIDLEAPLEIDEVVQRLCDEGRPAQAELVLLQAQMDGIISSDDRVQLARLSRTIQAAVTAQSRAIAVAEQDDSPAVRPPWPTDSPVPRRWQSQAILRWLHEGEGQHDLRSWEPTADDREARRLIAATRLWYEPQAWNADGAAELVDALAGFLGATWDGALERHGSDFVCRVRGLNHPAALALTASSFAGGLPVWLPRSPSADPPVVEEPLLVRLHWDETDAVDGVLRCHARTMLPLLSDRSCRRERFLARIGRDLPIGLAIPPDATLAVERWAPAEAERFVVEALALIGVEIRQRALTYVGEATGGHPDALVYLLRELITGTDRRRISLQDVSAIWTRTRRDVSALVRPKLDADVDLAPMFVAVGLASGGTATEVSEAFRLVTERDPDALDALLAKLVELSLVHRQGDRFSHAPTGVAAALYDRVAGEDFTRPAPRTSFEEQFREACGLDDAESRFDEVGRVLREAEASHVAPAVLAGWARAAAERLVREGHLRRALDRLDAFPSGAEPAAAQLLVELGDLEAARQRLDQLSRSAPQDADSIAARAAVRRGLGDLDGALEDYGKLFDVGTAAQRLAASVGAADVVRLSDPDSALHLLDKDGRPLLDRVEDPVAIARFHAAVADALADRGALGDLDAAEVLVRDHVLERMGLGGAVVGQMAANAQHARIMRRRARPPSDEAPGDLAESHAPVERAYALVRAIQDVDPRSVPAYEAIKRVRQQPAIEALSVTDFKNLERLEISFGPGSSLPGRWTCIVGRNGSGKSAILQAIVWALSGVEHHALGPNHLQRARRRVDDQVRNAIIELRLSLGREEAKVTVKVGDATTFEGLSEDAGRALRGGHVFVAYGAGRNLSSRMAPAEGDTHFVRRVRPLLDPFTQLAAADILLDVDRPSGRGVIEARAARLLTRLLPRVFASDLRVIEVDRAIRFVAEQAQVEASELAEGYRVAAAWLADLCLAWAETAPDEAASGDPARIRAIVLIDEIDAHLHVELQRVIVPRLRRALPEVQWIVTTHSPYIAASFDRHELIVLRDRAGATHHPDRQILSFSVAEVCEWLLGTRSHSGVVDQLLQSARSDIDELLGQSPAVSDQDMRRIVEWQQRLAAEDAE